MIVHMREKAEHLLKLEFMRFCMVGGSGFVVNFALLTILNRVGGLPLFICQLIGAEVALFSNFLLHHNWTYKHKKIQKSRKNLIVQFHATSWPAIIGSTVMVTLGVEVIHLNPLVALIISSVIALGWNFIWSKFFVWNDVSPQEMKEIV